MDNIRKILEEKGIPYQDQYTVNELAQLPYFYDRERSKPDDPRKKRNKSDSLSDQESLELRKKATVRYLQRIIKDGKLKYSGTRGRGVLISPKDLAEYIDGTTDKKRKLLDQLETLLQDRGVDFLDYLQQQIQQLQSEEQAAQ